KTSYDGQSVLLRKPLGEMQHGGGPVLQEDSAEYGLLKTLVGRLSEEEKCADSPIVAAYDDVELLSPRETWRKVTLNLAGRLPKSSEYEALDADTDALPSLLQALMSEEAFFERLIEIFNDQWLTDAYLRNSNNVLNRDDFPTLDTYYEAMDDARREAARRSLAREPLQLMA